MNIELKKHPERDKDTGLYRTLIVVEVLSTFDVSDYKLSEIAHEIIEGDSSGRYEVLDNREISRLDMAKLLIKQGSDPTFLLGDDAWVYGLSTGDEVFWNDPDDGICSRNIKIQQIEFHGDVIQITDVNGDYLEVKIDELS
jgi:hypothetical protein